MNARQKEYLNYTLEQEKKILKELKQVYNKALEDINDNIASLLGRTDRENLSSIIYQLDYQKALQKQINAILDDLNSKQYTKMQDYLKESYENGFLGTMYDLHGQDIPLIIPIDQEQVLEALTIDSKLSKKLYDRLGEDVTLLKNRVRANISRGIASNMSYAEIARNIKGQTSMTMNNAIRIARTEAGRIQSQASYDAQLKAKEKGADVVKQWDATLDGRTRTSHRILDGQIRELDEPFEYKGYKAMHPHGFGVPSLDINCRCAMLQRVRTALDEKELETLKERAMYYGLDKTKDFDEFKQKYVKVSQETNSEQNDEVQRSKLTLDNFPDSFKENKKKLQNTQKLIDFINNQTDADPKVVELFNKMLDMESFTKNGIPFEVKFGENNAVGIWYNPYTQEITNANITLQDLIKNDTIGAYSTNLHELGHLIDKYNRLDIKKVGSLTELDMKKAKEIFDKSSGDMSNEVKELFKNTLDEYNKIEIEQNNIYNLKLKDVQDEFDIVRINYRNGLVSWEEYYKADKECTKKREKLKKERKTIIDIQSRNIGLSSLEDIYDALSGGKARDVNHSVKYGHGLSYYRSYSSRISETFANYVSLSITRPDLIQILKRDKPELVDYLDNIVDNIIKRGR